MAFSCSYISEKTRLIVIVSGTTESNQSHEDITDMTEMGLGKTTSKYEEKKQKQTNNPTP